MVYLSREISRLATEGRPLSQGRDLSALYEERRPLYEHFADIRVDSTEIPDLTAYILIEKVKDGVKK